MRNVKMLWGLITALLLAVIVLSALLAAPIYSDTGGDSIAPGTTDDPNENVATIGNKTISRKTLVDQLIRRYGKEMLNSLIDKEVAHLEAESLGLEVTPLEVEQELKRMQQGYDSESQFYALMLEQLGMTREEIASDVRDRLLIEKIAMRDVHIDDETVREYMEANPDEFAATARFRLMQIVVGSRENANKVLRDLEAGISFSEVARERSLDDATRDMGGDLGWIEADDPFLAEIVMETARTMKTGQVSKPLKVDGQYVIIKMVERIDNTEEENRALFERVRTELALREAPPIGDMMETLRTKWRVSIHLSIDNE